jgi:DNA polymerase-3 subunit delta'
MVPTFSSIAGHRRPLTLLSQAIGRGTLPPTLLFTGPAGVGKYAVAKAVAAVLNCLSPALDGEWAIDACGVCRACERIARDAHVDVFTLAPDDRGSIKIDAVRSVLERTAFRPFEGRRRVVIIRDADRLEDASQNALLKLLEEPPTGSVFLLTTAVPGALLPTVRSRCMRLTFGRLTTSEVTDVLVRVFEMTEDSAREAAAMSNGGVGEALALSSTDVATLRATALLLLRQGATRGPVQGRLNAAGVLVGPPKKERPREDIALVLRFMASMLRDIELLNSAGDRRVLANPVVADELTQLTRSYAGDRAREAFAAVDRAVTALERNVGAKVVSEWLALQL